MTRPIHERLLEAVEHYTMPEAAQALLRDNPPLILCGITAAGKNTVANELIRQGGYESVISHTTRQPRINQGVMERDGINYHFVDEVMMLELIQHKQFVEAKPVHGKFYGTSIEAFALPLSRGNVPILDIDLEGAEEFVAAVPSSQPIFLLPPSFAIWQERLAGRGPMTTADRIRRMKNAVSEIGRIIEDTTFQILINREKPETSRLIRTHHFGRDSKALNVAKNLMEEITEYLGSRAII
jgi:guanylate kinase